MIKILSSSKRLLLHYTPDNGERNWVPDALKTRGEAPLKKTFYFQKRHVLKWPEEADDPFDDNNHMQFLLGEAEGNYYKIGRGILVDDQDIYLHKNLSFSSKLFVASERISIFRTLASLYQHDIYVGGKHKTAIPGRVFQQLIDQFPTTTEKNRYAQARVAGVLRNYLEDMMDAESAYLRLLNKRVHSRTSRLPKLFQQQELQKYDSIIQRLEYMLNHEDGYSESNWQEELLGILQLLYPKYIAVFREAIIHLPHGQRRELDYVLVDANGHVDIIEIKKPFGHKIMSDDHYRNNYIPLRELSGTIMQLEKYLYHLNRHAAAVEENWSSQYRDQLPHLFSIKVTNPSGIIIMGRDHILNEGQRMDFEVVKRKYKNIVDIITYDDLLRRLRITVEQLRKL